MGKMKDQLEASKIQTLEAQLHDAQATADALAAKIEALEAAEVKYGNGEALLRYLASWLDTHPTEFLEPETPRA